MYGYMTLSDGTGIAHSEMKPDGSVKVYFEKPIDGGFQNATCWLPAYRWENIDGFSEEEAMIFMFHPPVSALPLPTGAAGTARRPRRRLRPRGRR